jgi:excisionase family DNA binding protein
MDIVVAGIAVAAFAATVLVLTRAGGHTRPQSFRTVLLPEEDDPRWLTVQQVATLLELPPSEVVELVERDSIPFFVVRGGNLSNPEYLRFRRDEIDAWTIG